ncbi:MAG: DUF4296 domain-containing protein [Prevotella sp.]|nr:DUF4296 domain-containing protein [Prevotella sp.]
MQSNRLAMVMTAALCLWLVAACKPGTPSEYIQPDDMEDILVDYHLARAMAERATTDSYEQKNYMQALYIEAVMQKHGVTKAEFDSSLIYYFRRADRFDDMYERVSERLDEQALVLGASEREIGMYSTFNATGDTANIWSDRKNLAMLTVPPYNQWDFEVPVDTTFRQGDSFLMQFMADFMFEDGSRDGVIFLAVTYGNDTTICRNTHFSSSGFQQLRLNAFDGHDIKRIRGFFYLGNSSERSTTTRILFVNNIQFVRFHQKEKKKDEKVEESSVKQDSIARRADTDSVGSGDLRRAGDGSLPADSGTAVHRMGRRMSEPKTR